MPIQQKPNLDGEWTVSQTESECEQIQREGYQLIEIKYGTKTVDGMTFLINKTVFDEKLIGRLEDLHFYTIKSDDDIEDVKTKKAELGWQFMLKSTIYAQKLTADVLIFGK